MLKGDWGNTSWIGVSTAGIVSKNGLQRLRELRRFRDGFLGERRMCVDAAMDFGKDWGSHFLRGIDRILDSMSTLPLDDLDDEVPRPQPSIWKENHGNFLMIWCLAIVLLGTILLWYRSGGEPKRVLPEDFGVPVDDEQPSMIIRVVGKQGLSNGEMKIAVYDTEETFRDPSKAELKDSLTHQDGLAVWLIPLEVLPPKFGVAVYHDADGNGELTKNQLSMPIEPFGYSRNARGLFGSPPAFKDTLIERPTETTQTEILLQ